MAYEGDAFISYAHISTIVCCLTDETGWVANLQRALETRRRAARRSRSARLVGSRAARQRSLLRHPRSIGCARSRRSSRSCRRATSIPSGAGASSTEFCKAAEAQRRPAARRQGARLQSAEDAGAARGASAGAAAVPRLRVLQDRSRNRPRARVVGDLRTGGRARVPAQARRSRARSLPPARGDSRRRAPRARAAAAERAPSSSARPPPICGRSATRSAARCSSTATRCCPPRTLPLIEAEFAAAVRDDLASCRMSIHMFGGTYGMVPEGAESSLQEIQNELAAERARQRRVLAPVVDSAGADGGRRSAAAAARPPAPRSRMRPDTDLLETLVRGPAHAHRGAAERRARSAAPASAGAADEPGMRQRSTSSTTSATRPPSHPGRTRCSSRSRSSTRCSKATSATSAKPTRTRCRQCDGVLLFYGTANEVVAAPQADRGAEEPGERPHQARARAVRGAWSPPRTPEKERFRTHYCGVVAQWDGCDAAALQPFIDAARAPEAASQRRERATRQAILFPGCARSRRRKTICSSAARTRSTSCCGACAPTASWRWWARRAAASRR